MRLLLSALLIALSFFLVGQTDSLLTAVLWEETSPGEREGYVLRLNPYGTFEEDAGPQYDRAAQRLMGRYELDSTSTVLTLAVDFFMGDKLVHRRYRRGQDFYLDYTILVVEPGRLEIEDELTGKTRTFIARPIKDEQDAATRRINKIEFGKKKGGLKLPGGWGNGKL